MLLKYKMKVINKIEKNNELLSRTEFVIDLEFEGAAPTKQDVKVEICKSLKLDDKLSVIRKVEVGFKSNIAKVEVFVYSDETAMKRIESYLMHKKIEENLKKEEEAKIKAEEEAKAAKEAEKEAAAEKAKEDNTQEEEKEEVSE